MKEKLRKHVIFSGGRIIDAIEAIRETRTRCVVVLEDSKVVGVISEGDIMRALLAGSDVHSSIEGWISRDFKFLSAPRPDKALELMHKYGITMVPVLDASFGLQDVLTVVDILGLAKIQGPVK
mgnify:CR=1 FL=1